jgi:uncharacterized membrane protein
MEINMNDLAHKIITIVLTTVITFVIAIPTTASLVQLGLLTSFDMKTVAAITWMILMTTFFISFATDAVAEQREENNNRSNNDGK